MNPVTLPAFADNPNWMLHDGDWAVGAGWVQHVPVTAAPDGMSLQLAVILVTHLPPDPAGGVNALSRRSGSVHPLRARPRWKERP
jgi:glyoxylase-like metal-dependent hydrolase (beta-lactamase superfamily II)